MEIMELATALGQLIKEDERMKNLAVAKEAYENDKEIQHALLEYRVQQTALTEEYKKSETDQTLIDAIEARISLLYDSITESDIFNAFNDAQEQVNALMVSVNDEITFQITGERPSECSHDCSSCGGSCGHEH
jgi:Protein of unknown function (DUF964).